MHLSDSIAKRTSHWGILTKTRRDPDRVNASKSERMTMKFF